MVIRPYFPPSTDCCTMSSSSSTAFENKSSAAADAAFHSASPSSFPVKNNGQCDDAAIGHPPSSTVPVEQPPADADTDDASAASVAKPAKKWTWKKPKGKPKRPLSAYNIFFRRERERMVEEEEAARAVAPPQHEDGDGLCLAVGGKMIRSSSRRSSSKTSKKQKGKFSDLAKRIAERWADLDEPSRSAFEELASEDKRRYLIQLRRWEMEQDALGIPLRRRRRRRATPAAAGANGGAGRCISSNGSSCTRSSIGSVATAPSPRRGSMDDTFDDASGCMLEPLPVHAPSNLSPYMTSSSSLDAGIYFPAENGERGAFAPATRRHSDDSIGSFIGIGGAPPSFDAATSDLVRNNFAKLQKLYGSGSGSAAARQGTCLPEGDWSAATFESSATSFFEGDDDPYTEYDAPPSAEHFYQEYAHQQQQEEEEQHNDRRQRPEERYYSPRGERHPQEYASDWHHKPPALVPPPQCTSEHTPQREYSEQQQHPHQQQQDAFLSADELQFLTSGPAGCSGFAAAAAPSYLAAPAQAPVATAGKSHGGGENSSLSLQLDDATVDMLMKSVHALEDDYNNGGGGGAGDAGCYSGGSKSGNKCDASVGGPNPGGGGGEWGRSSLNLSLADLGAPLQQNPFTPHMA